MCKRFTEGNSCEEWKEEGTGTGQAAHSTDWTPVERQKEGWRVGWQSPHTWCLAESHGGRNGPAPGPPPSQSLAESIPRESMVSAWVLQWISSRLLSWRRSGGCPLTILLEAGPPWVGHLHGHQCYVPGSIYAQVCFWACYSVPLANFSATVPVWNCTFTASSNPGKVSFLLLAFL